MQFRRSGQRDDRRRRVLTDTLSAAVATARALRRPRASDGGGQTVRKSANYGDAEFMDEQPRVTDLIPIRLTGFLAVFVAGLAVIAGLEGLYAWMPQLAILTTDGRVATFDLDGEGSLAVWFSSMTLALAGLVAILVFMVRRHRTDDYPGRYRIWLWAASCWFLMSLDETSSLHEGYKEMMAVVTGTRVFGDGSIWWVAVYFFLLAAVGTRLLADMRECRLSTAALLATAACYGLAVGVQLGWILPESGARGVMVEEGAEMLGNLMLLMAMGLHARHVILDAEGVLPQRKGPTPKTDEKVEKEASRSTLGGSVVVHPPQSIPRPAGTVATPSRSRATVASAAQIPFEPEPDEPDAQQLAAPVRRKLTKAERKAMRRRLRKMQEERQRRERND